MVKYFCFSEKNRKFTKLNLILGISMMALFFMSCGDGGGSSSGGRSSSNDTQAPSAPASLTATTVSPERIDLSWSASTDNVGVTGYNIYRNDAIIKTITEIGSSERIKYSVEIVPQHRVQSKQLLNTGIVNLRAEQPQAYQLSVDQLAAATTYSDTGLSPNTTYCYSVTAIDAARNESIKSPEACTDTQPVEPVGCGTGFPLVLSNLNFPSVVTDGTDENGSADYEGSFEDILNPVMIALIPTTSEDTYSANFAPIEASRCTINFTIYIPRDLLGTGPIYFRLVEYDENLELIENYDNNGVSNDLSQEITIN